MRSPRRTQVAALALLLLAAGCGGEQAADEPAAPSETEGGSSAGGAIGVDFPRADSDFWTAYATYVPRYAEELDIELLPPTSSQGDVATLVGNVDALVARGAEAIVMAPQDTGAITATLASLNEKGIPAVSIDTRPDEGEVYMVVRADNVAMGRLGCEYIGEKLGGEGRVVEFQGGLDSVNGRDRSEGFATCMQESFPDIDLLQEPTEWDGARAASALQTRLAQGEVDGIFMPAGGVYLQPTLQVLDGAGRLVPAGEDGHVVVVSVDGIPEELEAIREGTIDAAVSQPADLYARYGLSYAQAALDGETVEPGPTDHDSTVVEVRPGVLEDQLPSVLVTSENVDDESLWGNGA